MKIIFTTLIILILASCGIDKESAPPISSIASGDLDDTFSDDGFLIHHNAAAGSSNDEGYAIAVDSNRRVVVVGTSINGSGDTDLAVWAYDNAGNPDTTFSSDGVFTHGNAAGGSSNDAGFDLAIDSSNNIFVTGYSVNGSGNFDMVVWKIKPDGTLDNTFGTGGIYSHDSAAGGSVHDQGNSIHISAAGQIYVAGYSDQTASNRDMAIWRLTSAGAPDNTFSGDGIVTSDGIAGGEDDIGNSIITDVSGNVYVAGRADSASNSADMAVWAYDSSGTALPAFNGGSFTHNNAAGGNAFDAATDLAFDSLGALHVTGYSRNASNNNDMVVWKVAATGALDATFNSGGSIPGIFVFDISAAVGISTSDSGEAITVDPNGNILVVGHGNTDVVVWRLTAEGVLDESYNGDGSFFHDSAAAGFGTDAGLGLYFDTVDERLYVTGYSENASGNFDMTIWRLR